MSATIVRLHKRFCEHNRMSVGPARKRKPSIFSVSYGLNRFNRCSRGRTTPLRGLCQNMVRKRDNDMLGQPRRSILSFKEKPMSYTISIAMRTFCGVLIDPAADAEAAAQPHFIRLLIDHFFLFYPHRNLYTEEKTPPNIGRAKKTKRMKRSSYSSSDLAGQHCLVPRCSVTFWTHPEIIPVGQFFRRGIKSINQSSVDFHCRPFD